MIQIFIWFGFFKKTTFSKVLKLTFFFSEFHMNTAFKDHVPTPKNTDTSAV